MEQMDRVDGQWIRVGEALYVVVYKLYLHNELIQSHDKFTVLICHMASRKNIHIYIYICYIYINIYNL